MTGPSDSVVPRHGDASGSSRREFILGGSMGLTAIGAWWLTAREGSLTQPFAGDIGALLPDRVGRWQRSASDGVLIPTAEEADDRIYDDVLTRYYVSDSGPAVMLLIAYGSAQNGTAQLHRPEACYPAAGFRLQRWPDLSLRLGRMTVPARQITATAPGRVEQILYWSRIGDFFPTSSMRQHWAVFRSTLAGQVPNGVLVRMSVIDPDRSGGVSSLRDFAIAFVDAAPSQLQRLLIGHSL